jgi:CheY-like chemotaxis protein
MSTPKRILVVDDDRDDQFMFKDALHSIDRDIICDTAENGQLALDYLLKSKELPGLIFLDLNMPVMDGYAFIRQAIHHELMGRVPIGVLSTSSHINDMKTTKALGCRFFLTKPNDFATLRTKLHKIITHDYANSEYLILI